MIATVKEKKKLGRKASLTPEKIIETIEQMQRDGDKVTACTIRGQIGFGGLWRGLMDSTTPVKT